MVSVSKDVEPGYSIIYCTSFKHFRTKKIIRAIDHGKKFFRLKIKNRKPR